LLCVFPTLSPVSFLLLCPFVVFYLRLFLVVSLPHLRPGIPAAELRAVTTGTGTDAPWLWAYQSLDLRTHEGDACSEYAPSVRQRFSVQVGTGAKAPPDPPCEPTPAAFFIELMRLDDETPSFFAPSAACGSADGDAVGIRRRAPTVSTPPRSHTDTAGAAVRALVHL
jgi:hypothetical protein